MVYSKLAVGKSTKKYILEKFIDSEKFWRMKLIPSVQEVVTQLKILNRTIVSKIVHMT